MAAASWCWSTVACAVLELSYMDLTDATQLAIAESCRRGSSRLHPTMPATANTTTTATAVIGTIHLGRRLVFWRSVVGSLSMVPLSRLRATWFSLQVRTGRREVKTEGALGASCLSPWGIGTSCVLSVLLSSGVSLRVTLSEASEHRIRAYRKIIWHVDPLLSSRTAVNSDRASSCFSICRDPWAGTSGWVESLNCLVFSTVSCSF